MPQRKNTDIVNEMFFGDRAAGPRKDEFIFERGNDDHLIETLSHVSSRERFEEAYPTRMWAEIDEEVELPF